MRYRAGVLYESEVAFSARKIPDAKLIQAAGFFSNCPAFEDPYFGYVWVELWMRRDRMEVEGGYHSLRRFFVGLVSAAFMA